MSFDLRRWPEADAILDAALALPPRDRADYVRKTVDDPALAIALQAILAAGQDDGFLSPAGAWSGALADELRTSIDEPSPALRPGTSLEHYDVIAPLGRGGMGEVYRARDTSLGREVALKVLPSRHVGDAERQARFAREARVLASLNHPGIAAIYGLAEAGGVNALVLELVEGPTLAQLLQSGPLPLDRVVNIARQLVDAIAAAHARGILHRDLKPANIKIAPPSVVKILDFGLARVLAPPDADPAAPDQTSLHSSRVLLGTAAYMSPEQARGHRVDERSDIWAFGCVLYEMLTATRAFAGDTITDVLAAVIERDPPFAQLNTPAPLRRLLRRCLQKDPERRLAHIADARLELDDAMAEPEAPVQARHRWRSLAAVAALALLIGAGVATWYVRSLNPPPAPVARLYMPLPQGDQAVAGFQPTVAISPDGKTVIYRARRGTMTQLFRRDLDRLDAVPIPGTESSTGPFFSPDGQSLGFDADGVLKRVPLSGGTPVFISNAPGGATATWLSDNTIVFATNTTRVLQRVPASGGPVETLTTLDVARGDTLHLLPESLPGGRAILFTIAMGAERRVAALSLATKQVEVLTEGSSAHYLPAGLLVFLREGALWGTRFDPDTLRIEGNAVPVDDRIAHNDNVVFHYAAGAEGSLVYWPSQSAAERQRLVWIDRAGRESPINLEPRLFSRVSLAPDGNRLALAIEENGNTDVWISDPVRTTMTRLTLDPTIETMPTWSPDGQFVAFRSERERPGIFRRDARGAGSDERLTSTDGPIHSPYSWTPDGKTLLLAVFRSFRQQAIGSVTPPDTQVRILIDGEFAQLDPEVSPNGRWMAYQSDETGRFEIYVRPFPDVQGGRWLVSTAGGTSPRWGPDSRELFYYDGEALVRVPVQPAQEFSPGRPARVAVVKAFGGRLGPDFEIAPDGRRFLFVVSAPPATQPSGFIVVRGFGDELRTRLVNAR